MPKSLKSVTKKYVIQLIIIFVLANSGVALYLYSKASGTCMTQAQINADTRCLYVYNNSVYEMGTKNSPHAGHNCGTNFDSTNMPSFHFSGSTLTKFNGKLIAPFCTGVQPTATVTATATATATATTRATATATSQALIGDVNSDGHVNMTDIGIVVSDYDKTNPLNPRSDVDGSGRVNIIDIGLIIDNYE